MRRILKCAMIAAAGSSFASYGSSSKAAEEGPRSIAATPGDVNSDVVVTMADVELMIGYSTSGGEAEPDEAAADGRKRVCIQRWPPASAPERFSCSGVGWPVPHILIMVRESDVTHPASSQTGTEVPL